MDLKNFKTLKSPYILILVGTPLSGKTFFYKKFKSEIDNSVLLISRDEILMNLYGGLDYNEAFNKVDQKEVNKKLLGELISVSKSGKSAIIDMTNLTSKRRVYNLSFFKNYYKVAVIFPILDDNEYKIRNLKRTEEEKKNIPFNLIKKMITSYQSIQKNEGFDEIIFI
jgi:predicted kinase